MDPEYTWENAEVLQCPNALRIYEDDPSIVSGKRSSSSPGESVSSCVTVKKRFSSTSSSSTSSSSLASSSIVHQPKEKKRFASFPSTSTVPCKSSEETRSSLSESTWSMLSSSALSEPPELLRPQLSSPDSPQGPEKKRSPPPPWQPPKQKKRTSLSESAWSMISSSISAAESFKLPQEKRNSSLPSISGITKPMIPNPNPNPNPITKRKSSTSSVSTIPEKNRNSTSTSYLLGKRSSGSEDNSIWESPLSPPPDDISTWESPLSPPPERRRKSSEKKRKSSEKRRKSHEKKRKLSKMSMYSDISDSPVSPPPEKSLKLSRMSMYSDISDTPASPPPEKRRQSTDMSMESAKSEQSQASTQSKVNEPWYMRTLDPSAGPRGFARGLEPIKVLAATDALGDIMHLMQWKGCSQIDLVSHEETSTLCPHLVIEYYEQLLSWHNVPNLTDVILGVSNWKKKGYVNRYRDRYGKKGPRPTEIL
ncbi:uncharacterized protein DDB_G0271670-like [Drosophila guanche]|uniref:Blast:Chromobox protein homolog 1 n=1 Tax=Drosophila guanche TaxID=7266 RepID=A0A3B0K7H9_DROGU|nr:uncharacterized protein DDB_G0271670-like [Drosophila guanche]SPP88632.1 blast:Chromobox protein homolog 1 [Drosophila guanche]